VQQFGPRNRRSIKGWEEEMIGVSQT
jgi:hypothetical protein